MVLFPCQQTNRPAPIRGFTQMKTLNSLPPQAPFRSRAALKARADHEFKNGTLATFPREFDKGLETINRIMSGKFIGRYWADRACTSVFEECGALLVPTLINGTNAEYRLLWADDAN